jgi:hypothetical protein
VDETDLLEARLARWAEIGLVPAVQQPVDHLGVSLGREVRKALLPAIRRPDQVGQSRPQTWVAGSGRDLLQDLRLRPLVILRSGAAPAVR